MASTRLRACGAHRRVGFVSEHTGSARRLARLWLRMRLRCATELRRQSDRICFRQDRHLGGGHGAGLVKGESNAVGLVQQPGRRSPSLWRRPAPRHAPCKWYQSSVRNSRGCMLGRHATRLQVTKARNSPRVRIMDIPQLITCLKAGVVEVPCTPGGVPVGPARVPQRCCVMIRSAGGLRKCACSLCAKWGVAWRRCFVPLRSVRSRSVAVGSERLSCSITVRQCRVRKPMSEMRT